LPAREVRVDLAVTVEAREPGAAVRALREWLVAEPVLRGRVRLVQPAPQPGSLGGVVEALTVALGQGGAATALVSVLVAWIRRRVGDVSVTLTRPDGTSVKVDATHVRGLDSDGVADLVADIARSLDGTAEESDGEGG
jgi:hypothetical protein